MPDPTPLLDRPDRGRRGMAASTFTRRRLLIGAGTLGAAGLAAAAGTIRPWDVLTGSGEARPSVRSGQGKLVLVTLYGGNDGLNTVVPLADSAYNAGRPNLGYQPGQALRLSDDLGLNPKLTGLKSMWDARQLAVVLGVGYPNPSLSHFQSMDIWQTANPEGSGSGWLGRWLDATGRDPMRAISVGVTLPTALRGDKTAATVITSGTITIPGRSTFIGAYTQLAGNGPDRAGLAGLAATSDSDLLSVRTDLDRLHVTSPSTAPAGGKPAGGTSPTASSTAAGPPARATAAGSRAAATSFSDQLGLVASLLKTGAPTRVYQVSLSNFDTHGNEKATHERLLAELDAGITGFFHSLAGEPIASDVVLMTYSEFGRRVAENASGGTDHGTASPLFVAGPAVRGGRFYGEQPSLTDLDDGDLKYNVDFRSVYATMLDRVVGVDPKPFLGAPYPTLTVV